MGKIIKRQMMIGLLTIIIVLAFFLILNVMRGEQKLSDLQITACSSADAAGTCDSRLPEVGIVLKSECCKVLGKCCS